MTLGLVLLIVEVLAPAVRRQLKRWRLNGDRRPHPAEAGRRRSADD